MIVTVTPGGSAQYQCLRVYIGWHRSIQHGAWYSAGDQHTAKRLLVFRDLVQTFPSSATFSLQSYEFPHLGILNYLTMRFHILINYVPVFLPI